MIVLDTNVISEPLKPLSNTTVVAWLNRQPRESLYLCAPVLMELLLGVAVLPAGKRKKGMAAAIESMLANYFADRFLVFDREAAVMYALLAGRTAAHGYILSVADGQIAAIAAVHEFAVATRDTAPFKAAGVETINPWEA